MLAAYKGHAPLVELLCSHGADPKCVPSPSPSSALSITNSSPFRIYSRVNDRGQSPLAGAIFKNEEAVIRALLEGGADPFAGNPSGFDTAKLFGKLEVWGEAFENAKGKGSASGGTPVEGSA